MSIKYPVYQPRLAGNEKKYVNECLDSTWISSKGKFIQEFEKAFAQQLGIPYAISVSNGTVALHLALLASGIGPGDEVLVPSFTYIASVNAITYTGAVPVFVDSCSRTLQMDPNDLEHRITTKTKAIMPVHLYGDMCDMDKIMAIALRHGLQVIEDCAEAFGSSYQGKPAGTMGTLSTFSFFGNKTITTGEGGMVVTKDPSLYQLAMRLKGQGLAEGREYWHDIIGYNYRMTNICAAIGLAQLEQATDLIREKREIASHYNYELQICDLELPAERPGIVHTYWMYTILVTDAGQREPLRAYLKSKGIETRPTFYPVHHMPMYASGHHSLPVADDISSRGINLPSYPGLTKENIQEICGHIRNFLTQ